MIIDSQASLLITSETHTSAEVTRVLGLEPSRSWEKGDPMGKPRDGRQQRYRDRSGWRISCAEGEPSSISGFMGLASALEGKEGLLADLRAHYEMSIWWDGITDSEQPGFHFTIEALRRIAELGCDVMGSAALVFGTESGPIRNVYELRVSEADRAQFEEHFGSARWSLLDLKGFQGAELVREARQGGTYILTTRWATAVDADSAAFAEWCSALPGASTAEPRRFIEVSRTAP